MAQVYLNYPSTSGVSSSSGQVTAPNAQSPVPNVLVTVGSCPAGTYLKSFDATPSLDYGPTAPPVTVSLTIAGAVVGSPFSLTRVGSSNIWAASRSVNALVANGQSIGLKWNATSGSPSFSNVTLSVVATDWGETDF